jgi:hypothetical protein
LGQSEKTQNTYFVIIPDLLPIIPSKSRIMRPLFIKISNGWR